MHTRGLWRNFLALSILQIGNYLFPLLTFPYLVRVLGPEKFGLVALAQSFIQFFVVFTDYGFNLSATRAVSRLRRDVDQLGLTFFSVLTIKAGLCVLSLGGLALTLLWVPRLAAEWRLYLLTFGMVFGAVLFPQWFFQGLEKMEYITALNVASRFLILVLTVLLVKQEADYLLVPVINSGVSLACGGVAAALAWRHLGYRWVWPTWRDHAATLRDGLHLFLSQAFATIYNQLNVFLLGMLTSATSVGYYAAGEKLVRAVIHLSVPLSAAIFPRVSHMFLHSRDETFRFLRRVAFWGGLVFLGLSLATLFLSPWLVPLVLGRHFGPSVAVVQILAVLPLTIFLDNILGTQILINLQRERAFFAVGSIAGVINLALLFVLVPKLHHLGAAWAYLLCELFILAGMYFFARRVGFRLYVRGQ
ncbi:MAG: flippase [Syntrophobacterales bacterium]|nr:flippase [Syntrophobacterales bacterium]